MRSSYTYTHIYIHAFSINKYKFFFFAIFNYLHTYTHTHTHIHGRTDGFLLTTNVSRIISGVSFSEYVTRIVLKTFKCAREFAGETRTTTTLRRHRSDPDRPGILTRFLPETDGQRRGPGGGRVVATIE